MTANEPDGVGRRGPTGPPILVVMLDGLGDRPWPLLGGLTPLAAADTPNLDALARAGTTGLLHSLGPGRAPSTELAHFVLFGYEERAFPGRAVFEAAGAGVMLAPGQVALHATLVSVRRLEDSTLEIVERHPRCEDAAIADLFASVKTFEHDGLTLRLHPTRGEQAILTLEGDASTEITDTDPHNTGWLAGSVLPLSSAEEPLAAARTARALTAYLRHAYTALRGGRAGASGDDSPFLLLKWPGRKSVLPTFEEQTGMRGCVVSSAGVLGGLAAELGMEHRVLGVECDLSKDMWCRMTAAREAIAQGAEFVLAHSKMPDEAGHAKDPDLKREVIARIDRGLAGLAQREGLPRNTIVVVTGDHGTPAGTSLIHSGDPVPLAVLTNAARPDAVGVFDDLACASGALGQLRGSDFMPMLLNWRGTVRYTGGKLAAHTGLHWPADYPAFTVE